MPVSSLRRISTVAACAAFVAGCSTLPPPSATEGPGKFADAHFHIANYAYQGASLKQLLRDYMKDDMVRSTVMPLPLQQKWDGFEQYAGDKVAPTYYLGPKAELYYYAFADAMYAKEYLTLSPAEQSRLDLMITGFNPMDRYAAQHIKRALLTFPGAFAGIGEFTVHKELVSRKIAGDPISYTAAGGKQPPDTTEKDGKLSLYSPALVDILKTVAETGLVATLHNDIYPADVTYDGTVEALRPQNNYEAGLKQLCVQAPGASVIWAHTGLGRFVKPTRDHLQMVSRVLDACPGWSVDISWDIVQERFIKPEPGMPTTDEWAQFVTRYQDRVLWGSDTVIYSRNVVDAKGVPTSMGKRMTFDQYMAVPKITSPLFEKVGPQISQKVRVGNYVKLFDGAKKKVRAWEAAHAADDVWDLSAR